MNERAMRAVLKAGLVALVLFLSLSAPAGAGPLEDGKAAYDRGDYATSLRLWRPLAAQGNGIAQALIGSMYAAGQGVPQDYGEAMRWLRKAADQGEAFAQTSLGFMFVKGQGVPKDDTEALKWFRKAAEHGIADAQNNLGAMYAKAQGVP